MEAVKQLEIGSAKDAVEWIAAATVEYEEGRGRNLKRESLALAQQWGLDQAQVTADWTRAEWVQLRARDRQITANQKRELAVAPSASTAVARVVRALVPAPKPAPLVLTKSFDFDLPVIAAAADQVDLLNQKHAVIGNYGDKVMVLGWEPWEINPNVMVPRFQTFEDFGKRYSHRYVEVKSEDGDKKKKPAGKYWLSNPDRQTYDAVTFEPGAGEVLKGNRVNLWRGFALEPKAGKWPLMHDHIHQVLGGGDPEAGRYIVWWIAWMLQHPGERAEVVLVLKGEEGAGKGILARALLRMFGAYGLPVSDQKHLTGGFSGHLQHCVFLFLDEAFWAGNVAAEGRLKSLVTEETIMLEPKYVQAFQVRNVLHIMMASNSDWVVPAGHGARRYAVFEVSADRMGDKAYFDALGAEMNNGGVEAMMFDLLQLDLGDWHPKLIYKTAALTKQKQRSLRGLDAWIETMLQRGALPYPVYNYPNRALSESLLEEAKRHDQYTNDTVISVKLKEVFGEFDKDPVGMKPGNSGGKRLWIFPPLLECRAKWEKRNGGEWPWHQDIGEWSGSVRVLDQVM